MYFKSALTATILAFASTNILAAPIPQLAGEGAACNSILSSTDNGVGYSIEYAEENTAGAISHATSSRRLRRQLAGEGAACNSILSQTDNGVGHGIENAEENTAGLISTLRGGAGGGTTTGGGSTSAPPPPPPKPHRQARQLDKIAQGAQAIGKASGVGSLTSPFTTAGNSIDGLLTSGAANIGAQVGDTEAGVLEATGKAVPKLRRQLDKIANGAQAIGNAAGIGSVTSPVTTALDNLDGSTTSGAANIGAEAGDLIDSSLEGIGKAVPRA